MSIRLQIRGPSSHFIDPSQVEDARALAEDLRDLGIGAMAVEVAPPEPGTPMASGVAETLIVYIAGPAAATLTALTVTDLYRVCKRWVSQRMRKPEQHSMRFGKGVILAPDGSVLREWQTTRLPDGKVTDSDPD